MQHLGWRSTTLTLAALLLGAQACAGRAIVVDTSLPDGAPVEASDPAVWVAAARAGDDAYARGLALAALVRAAPVGEAAAALAASFDDEDLWVRRRAVRMASVRLRRANPEPGLLAVMAAFASREGDGDPARALAAHALLDLGHPVAAEGWTADAPTLAALTVSVRLAPQAARSALLARVAGGELVDDPEVLDRLVALGGGDLAAALAAGIDGLEDEFGAAVGFARARLGDAEGRADWLRALRGADPGQARDALDLALRLPPGQQRKATLRPGRGAKDPAVRRAASLAKRPLPDRVLDAASADPFLAEVAVRLAAEQFIARGTDPTPALTAGLTHPKASVVCVAAWSAMRLGLDLGAALDPLTRADDPKRRACATAARYVGGAARGG